MKKDELTILGGILVAIGVLWLLAALGIMGLIFPFALIGVGVWLLRKSYLQSQFSELKLARACLR